MLEHHRLFYIGVFGHAPSEVETEQLDVLMNQLSDDWIRLTVTAYVVWTLNDVITFQERLPHVVGEEAQSIIVPVGENELVGGRLPAWAWEWINLRPHWSAPRQTYLPPSTQAAIAAGTLVEPKG